MFWTLHLQPAGCLSLPLHGPKSSRPAGLRPACRRCGCRAISCGAEHTIAITPEDVITWGSNEYGQCGHGDKAETDWVKPRSIKMLHEQMVTQVICGMWHTLCVTATSQVYAWGRNSSGQLGVGDTVDRRGPTRVEGLWALPVLQLAAGGCWAARRRGGGLVGGCCAMPRAAQRSAMWLHVARE